MHLELQHGRAEIRWLGFCIQRRHPHEGEIIGTKKEMEALRAVVTQALENGESYALLNHPEYGKGRLAFRVEP